jgi:NTE family protein
VLRQAASILLAEKEHSGLELLASRYPDVAFVDIAPDIGNYGYLSRISARSVIMRGYGAGLRALALAKEDHVFDRAEPGTAQRANLRTVAG